MPGVAVVDSGNYDLQIETGFIVNAFTLDNVTSGVLDNTFFVLDGNTEYANVMADTTNIKVRRGRRDVGDQFSAGTMTFTIRDVDGIFNPFDDNSPYYDTPQSKPGLAPMRKVQAYLLFCQVVARARLGLLANQATMGLSYMR